MTVRTGIRLVTAVALLCAALAVLASIHLILTRGFSRLEGKEVVEASRQTQELLRAQQDALGNLASDWAVWDDTYRFVADGNEKYLRAMLSNSSLAGNGIEFIYYLQADGSLRFARAVDLHTSKTKPLPASLWPQLTRSDGILSRSLKHGPQTGLLLLREGVAILAARPILPTNKEGPPDGVLVMGRFLRAADWRGMASYPAVSVRAWRSDERGFPALLDSLRRRLSPGQVSVQVTGVHSVAGYSVVDDLYGTSALLLRTDLPRTLYQEGTRSLFAFGLVLLAVALGFGLAVNLLLDRFVTSRLSLLRARLREIADRGEASARIVLPGKDELSRLATDINGVLHALQRSRDALQDSESQLRIIIDTMPAGYLIIEADTHVIIGANSAALRMIGASEPEVIGADCHEFMCRSEEGHCPLTDRGEEVSSSERTLLTANGERLPVLKTAVPITLGGLRCIVESFVDISARKRSEEAVRHQAYHDSLTGLPNRASLYEELEKALQAALHGGHVLAVLLLDLDRFKTINDTLGHLIGDALLREVSGRLHQCLRAGDMIARLGGDEFAVLLPRLEHPEQAAHVAQRLLEALRSPFAINGYELHTSTSIGLSLFPKDGADAESLLQDADIALYHAKEQGRNTFRYYDTWISATTRERLSLENDLRHALDRGELLLHYQPQVHAPSGRVIGMEALLRWQHPEFGLLLPDRFIGLAEEVGLIEPIGEWVLQEACAQVAAWRAEGMPAVKVAVNLSPLQFHQHNLVATVQGVFSSAGLDPGLLELELTESTAMRNVDFSVRVMADLKAMGLRLCLDDFGVGYTSLVYLKQFPLDTVKIDRTFLSSLQRTSGDAAIVSAILGIARSLGLGVIGEGVETEEQLRFLLAHGCEVMQGYLFSRPITASAMADLLRARTLALLPLGHD